MEIERKSWRPWFRPQRIKPEDLINDHPLDGCDAQEVYQIMMSERADLIKAKRESEDRLVGTIIKFASALIVLMVGFSVQKDVKLTDPNEDIFFFCAISLMLSVAFGLLENFYSSKAYESQIKILIDFYTKVTKSHAEPIENAYVYWMQVLQFLSFAISLLFLAIIAVGQIGDPA